MSKKTNVELVTEFMEYSRNGALSQIFLMEAVNRYADQLDALTDLQVEAIDKKGSIVNMVALRRTAREWKEKYKANTQL
jgi:hypothetical protein